MSEQLRAAAREYMVRYGGDTFPNLFRSARGAIVIDDTGREILDFTSGQMCATIGHNHPAIVRAVTYIIPARYFVSTLQTLFLAGNVGTVLLINLLFLIASAVVFIGLTAWKTQRRLD